MADPKERRAFVITVLIGVGLLLWTIFPYLVPVLLGGILALLSRGIFQFFSRRLPKHRALAALLATSANFLLVVIPVSGLLLLVINEFANMLPDAKILIGRLQVLPLGDLVRRKLPVAFASLVPSTEELAAKVGAFGSTWVTSLMSVTADAASSIAVNGFLLFVSTYYFYIGGNHLLVHASRLLPIERRYQKELGSEFKDTAEAVIYGSGLTALTQAALLFVILLIAGVPHAIVWAAVSVVTAFVPLVGAALVWVPIGLLMLITGEPWRGLVVLGGGAVLISSIDNLVRPIFMGNRMHAHPLIIFLSLFGGLTVFGVVGLVLGPLIASLATVLVRIWERDFANADDSEEAPPATPPGPALETRQQTPEVLPPKPKVA